MSLPVEVPFTHLLRLTDSTGLFEHARGAVPRRDHGYCVDDAARGLVVLAREPRLTPELSRVFERYLAFVVHAQTGLGSFRNRMGFDRRWHDNGGTGDWWGRALWGLGTVAARARDSWLRDDALACFERSVGVRAESRRSMAFAALGAAEVLTLQPDHEGARALLKAAADQIGKPVRDSAWPWPERRLHYANAVFPDVLLAAGRHLGRERFVADGLLLLSWLRDYETHAGHLSVTPAGGWPQEGSRPAFDQQPIEVSTLVDAFARAFAITGDNSWVASINLGVAWFLGDNDAGKPMWHADTGGGCDGLSPYGPSINQGAESTLALISTLQHGRAVSAEGA